MPNIIAFLLAAAWPLAKKVLLALGIGWLTYEGLGALGSQVTSLVSSNWGAMPASVLQILSLSGFSESLGIMLGGMAARIALVAVGKLGKVSA